MMNLKIWTDTDRFLAVSGELDNTQRELNVIRRHLQLTRPFQGLLGNWLKSEKTDLKEETPILKIAGKKTHTKNHNKFGQLFAYMGNGSF